VIAAALKRLLRAVTTSDLSIYRLATLVAVCALVLWFGKVPSTGKTRHFVLGDVLKTAIPQIRVETQLQEPDGTTISPKHQFNIVLLEFTNMSSSDVALPTLELCSDDGRCYENEVEPASIGPSSVRIPMHESKLIETMFDAPPGRYHLSFDLSRIRQGLGAPRKTSRWVISIPSAS
jgi:hypothetical protein